MAVVTAQEPYILEEKILKAIFKREDAILDTDAPSPICCPLTPPK